MFCKKKSFDLNLNTELLSFYRNKGVDQENRKIRDIWCFLDKELEKNHTYIQWLFPLQKGSKYNIFAPRLNAKTIDAIKCDILIRENIVCSFKCMMSFYGFHVIEGKDLIDVVKDVITFETKSNRWIKRGNHNYLRITRILKSMMLLGLNNYALGLYEELIALYQNDNYSKKIGKKTFSYWTSAMKQVTT